MKLNQLKGIIKAPRALIYIGKSKKANQSRNYDGSDFSDLFERFGEYEIEEITGFAMAQDELLQIRLKEKE